MEGRRKKWMLAVLILAVFLIAAALLYSYFAGITYTHEELYALRREIKRQQRSSEYYVSKIDVRESEIIIGIDDIDDEKIAAFRDDFPDLRYKGGQIKFRDSSQVREIMGAAT